MPTVLDTLLASIRKVADYNRDDTVPPAAILWPDEKCEWQPLVPRLCALLPHFLVLGPYDQAAHTGPAIWLRCVLAGRFADVSLPSEGVPILYLPGVSRSALRATDECPPALSPLAELQYRGVFWSQHSGKDWTLTAFLQAEKGGLNLRVARDSATLESIRRAFEKLVDEPVADLVEKRLSALQRILNNVLLGCTRFSKSLAAKSGILYIGSFLLASSALRPSEWRSPA